MNYIKKCHEIEEIKKEFKYNELKLNEMENKLSEKDSLNNALQTKLTKLEADLARMDYEYQKLRNKYG